MARMNLFMHNLTDFKVEVGDTLRSPRFSNPDGSVKQFDVIVANPPYSLKWKPGPKKTLAPLEGSPPAVVG